MTPMTTASTISARSARVRSRSSSHRSAATSSTVSSIKLICRLFAVVVVSAVCTMSVTACSGGDDDPSAAKLNIALRDRYRVDDPAVRVCVTDKMESWLPSERRAVLNNKGGTKLAQIVQACTLSGG